MTVTWSFNYFSKAILFTQNSNPEAYRILYDSINNDLHSLTESYKILSDKIKLEDPLEKNKTKQNKHAKYLDYHLNQKKKQQKTITKKI